VWLKPGTGKITINGRDQEVYFARPTLRLVINQPFGVAERDGQYDVVAPSRAAACRARPARSSTASPRR
jgi:ribosomal protein S9